MKFTIRVKHPTPTETLIVRPALRIRTRPLRVLDFDIENRPLSYLGSDFTTAEVTAISWAWANTPEVVTVCLLGDMELPAILRAFVEMYQRADLITGHYIRMHDLPMINGALVECRMPPLQDKMVSDTKLDFIKTKGISLSQESISEMLRLEHAKVHMTQTRWRAANRLTPEGLAFVRERVVGDVRQHMRAREECLRLGYLGPPRIWKSGSARQEQYVP